MASVSVSSAHMKNDTPESITSDPCHIYSSQPIYGYPSRLIAQGVNGVEVASSSSSSSSSRAAIGIESLFNICSSSPFGMRIPVHTSRQHKKPSCVPFHISRSLAGRSSDFLCVRQPGRRPLICHRSDGRVPIGLIAVTYRDGEAAMGDFDDPGPIHPDQAYFPTHREGRGERSRNLT